MKFKKGDRVVGIATVDDMRLEGVKGVVLDTKKGSPSRAISVRWDPLLTREEYGRDGHDCYNLCETGHGWRVTESDIKIQEEWVEEWR